MANWALKIAGWKNQIRKYLREAEEAENPRIPLVKALRILHRHDAPLGSGPDHKRIDYWNMVAAVERALESEHRDEARDCASLAQSQRFLWAEGEKPV